MLLGFVPGLPRQCCQALGIAARDVLAGRAAEQRVEEIPLRIVLQQRARLSEHGICGGVFGMDRGIDGHGASRVRGR